MKYLVDANVLSEPTKPTPDPRVIFGREHFASRRVSHSIQHHTGIARAPVRVADRQVEDFLFGLGG